MAARTKLWYHTRIADALKDGKHRGVNELSDIIDAPVSSVHRFLESQNYFVKTRERKWKIPAPIEEWPLFADEEKVPREILELINDPVNNSKKILKLIKYYGEIIDVTERRIEYLKRIAKDVLQENKENKRIKKEPMTREAIINRILKFQLDNNEINKGQAVERKADLAELPDEELMQELGRFL